MYVLYIQGGFLSAILYVVYFNKFLKNLSYYFKYSKIRITAKSEITLPGRFLDFRDHINNGIYSKRLFFLC